MVGKYLQLEAFKMARKAVESKVYTPPEIREVEMRVMQRYSQRKKDIKIARTAFKTRLYKKSTEKNG